MTIFDLLDRFNVPYAAPGTTPHVRPGWCGVVCPFCGRNSSNFGLGFNLDKRFWTCWKCGPKKAADVLAELLGVSDREARQLAASLTGEFDRTPARGDAPRGAYKPPKPLGPLRKVHRDYLRSRRLDPGDLERVWGVQGIGLHKTLAWRVFIPVVLGGEPVSWTTRATGDHPRRYWSAAPGEEKVPHKELLFGEDLVKHAVIAHEGPLDVLATGPGAVCTFGTNYTRGQVLRLSRFPVRYVCFDAEDKAQEVARRLCDELSVFPGQTHNVVLDTGKDSCEASDKERSQLRRLLK